VTELDGTGKTTKFTAVLRIRNNASGTYEVGPYRAFVDTQGDSRVREAYIVTDE
jgi:hypothetical protein